MIDVEDRETVSAIRLLFDSAQRSSKPHLVWVGAGASRWARYPTWSELANAVHSHFLRYCPTYETERGRGLIDAGELPALFQSCSDTDPKMYRIVLAKLLNPRGTTPVYKRFLDALAGFEPLQIVTTNVDELLERNLASKVATIQRGGSERAHQLSASGKSFVFKLHGSISDFDSMVFTSQDFSEVADDAMQLDYLRQIISRSSVLFVGYGLRDDHVVRLLRQNNDQAELFGDGPHFAVLSEKVRGLPASVRIIRYKPDSHGEHRSPIQVLEEFANLSGQAAESSGNSETGPEPANLESAHFLFDLYPEGKWNTSQTLNLEAKDGSELQAVVGSGFSDDEVRSVVPDAFHDLLVGLICFDRIYASTDSVGRFHRLLGSAMFWRLVNEDCLRFLHWKSTMSVIFPRVGSANGGRLESWSTLKPDRKPMTPEIIIRRQIAAAPQKKNIGEAQIADLASRVVDIGFDPKGYVSGQVRSLLLRPSIQNLLGISPGAPLHSLTRWNMFPILRLANVVMVGGACSKLGIASAKIAFGAARLAGPAFATAFGVDSADDAASYVLAGRFGANLGETVVKDRGLLSAVLRFRETQIAEKLRGEILSALAAGAGAEVVTAINGGLSRAIPPRILQEARDEYVGLFLRKEHGSVATAAIWNGSRDETEILRRWRVRGLKTLNEYCRSSGIGPYDLCPCGSGEKLKFCCQEALSK